MRKLALLALVSCATTPAGPPPRPVVVLESEPGPECKMLGFVTVVGGTDPWGAPGSFARDAAESEARQKAMKLSATHMKCEWTSAAPAAARPAGVVTCLTYDCSSGHPGGAGAEGEPSVGCTKDTDCKGSRICESGLCVNPQPPPAQRAW